MSKQASTPERDTKDKLPLDSRGGNAPFTAGGANTSQDDAPKMVFNRDRSMLLFAFLRRDMPPPSTLRMKMMVYCLCLIMVLLGWAAGAMGPLIPYLQEYYGINYITISIIFITNFAGGLTAGLLNVWLTDRLGFGLCAVFSSLIQGVAYALMSFGGPFPLFAAMYGLVGFGFSIADAQVNALSSRLPNATRDIFIIQACFGLGALIAPLISTAFVERVEKAYTYFIVSLAISIITAALVQIAFEGRTDEQILSEGHHLAQSNLSEPAATTDGAQTPATAMEDSKKREDSTEPAPSLLDTAGTDSKEQTPALPEGTSVAADPQQMVPVTAANDLSSGAKMRRIAKLPLTWTLMLWNLFYVGAEVALGSWATSYLISEKGGNLSAGYVTTGYYAGMTIGRVALMPLTNKMGYNVSIQAFTVAALVCQILSWVIPNLIGSAVFISLVGLFLGPIYPAELMVIAGYFDEELQAGVMGFMGAMGGAGAAIIPFVTGALSDRFGIWVMQPFCIALFASLLILWSFVPTTHSPWVMARRILSRRSKSAPDLTAVAPADSTATGNTQVVVETK